MAAAIETFVDSETIRKIRAMSYAKLSTYLYSLYMAGYRQGLADGAQMAAAVRRAVEEGVSVRDDPSD